MQCSACTADVPDEDLFCEICGTKLDADAPSAALVCVCGAGAGDLDEDGFCLRCGRRVRRPPSDHIEEALSTSFAAISDRGLRHEKNEDRFAVAQYGEASLLVICDGVSATPNAELASATVSSAVLASLLASLESGDPAGPEQRMREGIAAGTASLISALGDEGDEHSPSTTVVAALVHAGTVTVGWVGDSRAYWIDATEAKPLTRDHSWQNAVVSAGILSPQQAETAPQAHAITRWIGVDAGEAATPDIVQHTIVSPGTLLLCSDGLWNYAPTGEAMHSLLRSAEDENDHDALAMGRWLVAYANGRGGHDNITVALLRTQPPEAIGSQNTLEPPNEEQRTNE